MAALEDQVTPHPRTSHGGGTSAPNFAWSSAHQNVPDPTGRHLRSAACNQQRCTKDNLASALCLSDDVRCEHSTTDRCGALSLIEKSSIKALRVLHAAGHDPSDVAAVEVRVVDDEPFVDELGVPLVLHEDDRLPRRHLAQRNQPPTRPRPITSRLRPLTSPPSLGATHLGLRASSTPWPPGCLRTVLSVPMT